MRYVRLGRTDLRVSVLALGCGNFGGIGSAPELFGRGESEQAAYELMDAAYAAGITLFDTADAYGGGRSEEWIGRWLASRGVRDDIVLTTKVRNPMGDGAGVAVPGAGAGGHQRHSDVDSGGLSARRIRTRIEDSLRRLGTDHVDLYLAHAPDPDVPIDETLAAFDELTRAGKVRHTGLSNYSGAEVAEAVQAAGRLGYAGPVNLQSGYSLLDLAAAGDGFAAASRYGLACTAYSPLAGGWLAGRYRAGAPVPEDSRMALRPEPYRQWQNPATFQALDRLAGLAAGHGLALGTAALAWVLTDPLVTAAIIGPRRPEHLAPALAAVAASFTPADRAAFVAALPPAG